MVCWVLLTNISVIFKLGICKKYPPSFLSGYLIQTFSLRINNRVAMRMNYLHIQLNLPVR